MDVIGGEPVTDIDIGDDGPGDAPADNGGESGTIKLPTPPDDAPDPLDCVFIPIY
jgi:hypothetical protein